MTDTTAVIYPPSASAQQEAARRRIVHLVFALFCLLIFGGALRKWVFPELQRPLYFAHDPFVLLIYIYALLNSMILRSKMLTILIIFATVTSILHLAIAGFGGGHFVVWALGVHNYFMYIPLAFIIAYCFRFEDMARFIRVSLLISIPITIIVFMQYRSPPSAMINQTVGGDIEGIARVTGDMVRPYGTFTYNSGHVLYTAASVAVLAAGWLLRREMRLPSWLVLSASGAVMVMALTTGSRSIWFFLAHTALCLGAVVLSAVRSRNGHGLGAVGFIMLFVLAGVGLYSSVLAPAYEAMLIRQEQAQTSQLLLDRALGLFTVGPRAAGEAPILGFGLGSGILAAVAVTTGERAFALAEAEWARIMLELGPLFGLGFIALRAALVVWLLRRGLAANRNLGNPTGLLLLGFAGPHILVSDLTMSSTGALFGWLFAGLILAATNRWSRPIEESAAPTPTVFGRRRGPSPDRAWSTARRRSVRDSRRRETGRRVGEGNSPRRPGPFRAPIGDGR